MLRLRHTFGQLLVYFQHQKTSQLPSSDQSSSVIHVVSIVAVSSDQFRIIRQQVIDMVLATDMSKHFDHVNRFAEVTTRLLHPVWLSQINQSVNLLMCEVVLLCVHHTLFEVHRPTRVWQDLMPTLRSSSEWCDGFGFVSISGRVDAYKYSFSIEQWSIGKLYVLWCMTRHKFVVFAKNFTSQTLSVNGSCGLWHEHGDNSCTHCFNM